ncbi:Cupin domain-containing protein [Polaromonas sp. OV174]|uniref:cupin domain-containing protein n=1 Tax=Polaromonas sp. OV174 TaxID=1855300 RepID=UPI0008F2F923|nr:cupin domain-containing protein [Polaromonas sp. OV174]SFC12984.1 Cupin domain-containing protein [Polaromonas sp. OV174]
MSRALTYLRLYADEAGLSHFAPWSVALTPQAFAPPAPAFSVSAFAPAARYGFLHLPSGWSGDLHPSPQRMWIFVLAGDMEFEAGDGERQRIAPGFALLLEDTVGTGHRSRVLGEVAAVLAAVQL